MKIREHRFRGILFIMNQNRFSLFQQPSKMFVDITPWIKTSWGLTRAAGLNDEGVSANLIKKPKDISGKTKTGDKPWVYLLSYKSFHFYRHCRARCTSGSTSFYREYKALLWFNGLVIEVPVGIILDNGPVVQHRTHPWRYWFKRSRGHLCLPLLEWDVGFFLCLGEYRFCFFFLLCRLDFVYERHTWRVTIEHIVIVKK